MDCSFPSFTFDVRWRELHFEGGGEREGNDGADSGGGGAARLRGGRGRLSNAAADDEKVTK